MFEKTTKMTDEEVAQWQELLKLEPNCSTGRLDTPEEQKQKIDAMLARARARKKLADS